MPFDHAANGAVGAGAGVAGVACRRNLANYQAIANRLSLSVKDRLTRAGIGDRIKSKTKRSQPVFGNLINADHVPVGKNLAGDPLSSWVGSIDRHTIELVEQVVLAVCQVQEQGEIGGIGASVEK